MSARCWVFGAAALSVLNPWIAKADDLGEALAYITEASVPGAHSLVDGVKSDSPRDEDDAIPMLNSRDVHEGAPLSAYDCSESIIDGRFVMRTSGQARLVDRWCHDQMWKRDSLPGYRTLGQVRYRPEEVHTWIAAASAETEIPEIVLEMMIRYSSGYRPGVISDRGEMGLMQLRPEVIAEMHVRTPLDPRENIMAGARYFASLVDHFDGYIEPALAAFKLGIHAVEEAGGITPDDRATLWFVREVRRYFKAHTTPFPNHQAAEDIAYVMTWTD